MDNQKKTILAISLLVLAAGIAGFQMMRGGGASSGETTVNYKVQPPPDSAPLPVDQGGTGAPTSTYQPENAGTRPN